MAKKPTITKLKKKLWEHCKKAVRKRDGNVCIICGKENLEGSGWHTGHFLASSVCGAYLRYDIRNLHSSCYYCNINLGGNGALFLIALEKSYGREFVDQVVKDKQKIIKADILFYQAKIAEYEKISEYTKEELYEYTQNKALLSD